MTQHELAAVAGTSQPTIAAYESGRKSPTMRTVRKTARSVGLETHVTFVAAITRSDRRSLAYHRAIAKVLINDPESTLARASEHLIRLIDAHPHASHLTLRWKVWLTLPVEDLLHLMLDTAEDAQDMRQVSPFAGVLSAAARARVLRELREDYSHESTLVEIEL